MKKFRYILNLEKDKAISKIECKSNAGKFQLENSQSKNVFQIVRKNNIFQLDCISSNDEFTSNKICHLLGILKEHSQGSILLTKIVAYKEGRFARKAIASFILIPTLFLIYLTLSQGEFKNSFFISIYFFIAFYICRVIGKYISKTENRATDEIVSAIEDIFKQNIIHKENVSDVKTDEKIESLTSVKPNNKEFDF